MSSDNYFQRETQKHITALQSRQVFMHLVSDRQEAPAAEKVTDLRTHPKGRAYMDQERCTECKALPGSTQMFSTALGNVCINCLKRVYEAAMMKDDTA